MIGRLVGELLERSPSRLVVNTGGVGYEVMVSLQTYAALPAAGPVDLLIHTHVREDALALFGFLTAAEQTLFERLIAVAGVGPRLAIGILSGIETPDLVGALRSEDVARLTRIPGVGKKTAERLVVDLKDKMAGLEGIQTAPGEPAGGPKEDLVSALLHLGYSRPEAERGVEKALKQGEAPFEDLLRRTLRVLSGR